MANDIASLKIDINIVKIKQYQQTFKKDTYEEVNHCRVTSKN